jgi:AhpD family alkylhydroperoxidase
MSQNAAHSLTMAGPSAIQADAQRRAIISLSTDPSMPISAINYEDASPEVRAVFDDIKSSRNVPDVNNFWKYLARDPALLKRTWESVKEVMAPGALDPLTKEMIYLAVSVTNGCGYCIASHTAAARKAGMTDAMFGEVMAVTGMANETNRLANGYRVPVDKMFEETR